MEKRLGFVGIVVKDRRNTAPQVNKVFSEFADIITVRVGLPRTKENDCKSHTNMVQDLPYKEKDTGVIVLIVEATTDELGAFTGKLGRIKGVSVKSALVKEGKR